jgi:uncharacterized repeat protein (TIGR03803 family)
VFQLAPHGGSWTFNVLYNFAGGNDGENPTSLMRNAKGDFYGVTSSGGSGPCDSGCGTVFKLDATGKETVLHTFTGPDGQFPVGRLVQDKAGNLYGTTAEGGASSVGTAFKLTP